MESDMSEEDAYNLEDISSDVEIPPEELQDIEDDAA
jgi:FK506-binding nuclear protein